MRASSRTRTCWRSAAGLGLLLCVSGTQAQDAGVTGALDAGAAREPVAVDPRTAEVQSLIAGTLAPDIDPQTLFDVDLQNEAALQIDRVRLRALLRALDESAQPAPEPRAPAHARARAAPPQLPPTAAATHADIASVDAERWQAREALDRARLEFYELAPDRRQALLADHAARRQAAKPKETEAERAARRAEEERQRALAAARAARSERERIVAEEDGRLIAIAQKLATVRARFHTLRVGLAARRDGTLAWQRRVREVKTRTPADVDATYAALRRALHSSRDELESALDRLGSSSSEVPTLGADPLNDISPDATVERVRQRRANLAHDIAAARSEESSLREQRASTLLNEINALNRARLSLLGYLSAAKRDAITGFTADGFDQARSEARHLLLILRYHRHVVGRWIGMLQRRKDVAGVSGWRVTAVTVPWLIAVFAFVWFRRRSPALLALAATRIAELDRAERRTAPSPALRSLKFLAGVHRSLEWLLFFGLTLWLLPDSLRALLEIQLLAVIVGWTLGEALIVNGIHALASAAAVSGLHASDDVDRLRLRSLRLVGHVVVVFALILVLSARLVGRGTVYSWVLSTCWFAALPIFLILVRWWRQTVFERVERVRRKSRVQTWVLANRTGWKSFFAAMIAAVQLFALGAYKMVRNRLAEFYFARKAHAYLFKRELDRLEGERVTSASRPLPDDALLSLAPDRASASWVACPADEQLEALRARVAQRRGGVVAMVGARGIGKSSLLRRLHATMPGAVAVQCRADTTVADVTTALERAKQSATTEVTPLVSLDDADAFVKPVMGGLDGFDEMLALARTHSLGTLWLFAIDSVSWPFLWRARDARPMFDAVFTFAPWNDDEIGQLLTQRTHEADLAASFEDLLEKLPPSADEIDKQEALAIKRAGYFRMVWDYARGNPALALEVWRSSLALDAHGQVRVRALQAPDASELEALPDAALFVLRAVLQLAPATVADVAHAIRLSHAQVQNAFRFGQAHGYLIVDHDGARVAWPWLRSIILLLERRHLLVNP